MADFVGTTTVGASSEDLFGYLSDVSNLPRYFTRMTRAEKGEGEEVHTAAQLPDGREVQGDAWFRADAERLTIEWGSEGPSAYRGSLQVEGDGDGARIEVRLHTTRVDDDDPEVRRGIDETLASIRRLVEQAGVGTDTD